MLCCCLVFVLLFGAWPLAAAALGTSNIARTPGELLSGPNAPEAGRTPVIAYHGGMLFTFPEAPGSPPGDYQVRAWNIADPVHPVVTQVLGPTRHGFMAHGYIKQATRLNSGYTLEVNGAGLTSVVPDIPFRMLGWTHGGMSVPWGITNYWSYGDTSAPAEIYLNRPWGAPPNAVFDPVGTTGVIGHPFVFGRYLFYASDQSRTGIASYDISDPANPVLLDVLTDGSVGGYWPDPVGVNGKLYFFFPHDNPAGGFHVVDATDPSDLKLVADVPLEGNLNYAQFQDEFAFSERYKIDMRTFEVVLALDENATTRSGPRIDTSQFSLPVGNLLVTGGNYIDGTCSVPGFSSTHCGTGMSIWAHQAAPDTRGPFVAFHAPADGETGYPITHPIQILIHETLRSETINAGTVRLRPVVNGVPGAPLAAEYWFASNDILSIVPLAPLALNTTYRVELVADGVRDAVGNGMQPYSFEFATGATLTASNARPVISGITVTPRPVAPGVNAQFTAQASDADGDALEYRYDYGDGSALTAWTTNSASSHSYAERGHYTLTVQVRDSENALATRTTGVTVLTAALGLAGTHSSQLARVTTTTGERLWVVNPDADTVTVLNADTRAVIAEHRVCADPRSVAIDAAGMAWIACHDADGIAVLAADGERVATLDTGYGSAPIALAMNSAGTRALVSLTEAGSVAMFDTAARIELTRRAVGPTPHAIAINAAGTRAYVTRFLSAPMQGEVWQLTIGASSLTSAGTIALAHQWGEDLRFDGRGVPNYLSAIAITPDGTRAWVTAKKDNTTRGLYSSGSDLDQDNTVRAMVAQIDLASATERLDLRRDLDNSEQPSAVAFSPLGDYAFVSLQGSNAVLVLDSLKIDAGFSGVSSVVSRIGVGHAPQALAYQPRAGGDRLWVHAFLDRQASVIELGPLLDTGTASFGLFPVPLVAAEKLAASVLAGKRLFYDAADPRMSGEGYMGCATCHIDGGHDGRTWDFTGRGEGLRNTPPLHGRAGLGHGLVHWSANFDEIQDFEHDIRAQFGGQGFMTDADFALASTPLGAPKTGRSIALDQLAAYLSTLDLASMPRSPWRGADGGLTAAGVRGSARFAALGCAGCHAGVAGVANTGLVPDLRNIGTLGTRSGSRLGSALIGIDVPTLHGLWRTAPYLHNGEAATLEGVFTATGADVLQSETAVLTGGYEIRDGEHWSVDRLAVVRGGRFVEFQTGGTARFTYTAQGAGSAALALRYHANYQNANVTITVNGVAQAQTLPATLTNDWHTRNWGERIVTVALLAGANTISVRFDSGNNFALDEIALNDTVWQRSAAIAHRAASTLAPADFADLMTYLRQLDGRPAAAQTTSIVAPAAGAAVSGVLQLSGISNGDAGDAVLIALNSGPFVTATGLTSWTHSLDLSALTPGWHTVTVRLRDGATGTWSETQRQFRVTENNGGEPDAPTQIPSLPPLALALLALALVMTRCKLQR